MDLWNENFVLTGPVPTSAEPRLLRMDLPLAMDLLPPMDLPLAMDLLPPMDLPLAMDAITGAASAISACYTPMQNPLAWERAASAMLDEAARHALRTVTGNEAELEGIRVILAQCLSAIRRSEVTIAFAGHFNTGKSTLLNGLLGRDLLPVDDVIETGALCILHAGAPDEKDRGEKDQGWEHASAQTREFTCTSAALREIGSLLPGTDTPRSRLSVIDYLEVTLQNTPLLPGMRWMDTPGMDNEQDMTDCAWRGTQQADITLWVLNAKQILSQGEMQFISRCVEESGAESVVFALNAFLTADTPTHWQEFLDTRAQRLIGKVHDYASDMGFSSSRLPPIIPVSGRAFRRPEDDPLREISRDAGVDYGRDAVMALLTNIHTGADPRSLRTRLYRIGRLLTAHCRVAQSLQQQNQHALFNTPGQAFLAALFQLGEQALLLAQSVWQ